ncbi:MAG: alanine/glycine:cation symporter family protein [Hyphomicrobiales bacterium]
MNWIENAINVFSSYAWGTPLLVLLLGGGLYLLFYSRFIPFRYFKHAIKVLKGDFDESHAKGDIDHYEALSTAIAATVGLGNISGVAVAITMGGPGAIFWMWVSAIIGVTTKFFTCSLSVMYRGKDRNGHIEGGPMYVIEQGLGKKWKILAIFFSFVGMIGVSPMFQTNQLTQIVVDIYENASGVETGMYFKLFVGVCIAIVVGIVIFGGIKRIGKVAGKLVPFMVALYIICVLVIIGVNIQNVPSSFVLIFKDAFSGNAVLGGALGSIIVIGVKRAAFSNEAGIGTAPMAHGAALTDEPIREGLVAMLGPVIDTIIVCTMTALAIIVTGNWKNPDVDGVGVTMSAFEHSIPYVGVYFLLICVIIFSLTTLFAFPYYGTKCLGYLVGPKYKKIYNYLFIIAIVVGSVTPLTTVVNLIDGMYAMMAFPTMISALILSPKVKKEAKKYFDKLKRGEFNVNK